MVLTRGDGPALEVFLVRRSPALRFFGGYRAFVGGVVDAVDHDGDPDDDLAHRRCGLRELFEETGVLPAPLAAALGAADGVRGELRGGLLAGEEAAARRFRTLLDAHPAALETLRPFGRLTTPPFAPVRYRTRFLHGALPSGEAPEVVPGELVAGEWVRPAALLEAWSGGGDLVAPPTLWLLELMRERAVADFLAAAEAACEALEAGRLHRIQVAPGVLAAPLATPTIPPATTTNAWIVGDERLFVVDPATWEEAERRRLFALLDDLVAEGRTLAGVVATHHHHDHVGSVQATAERYGAPVIAHPRTLARLPEAPRDPRPLEDGGALDLGPRHGRPWRLVAHHTPGHDRGHLVLVEDRHGTALVGDLVSTLSTIVIDPPEGHMATYWASLERMLDEPLGVLCPAHGPTHPDARAVLRRTLEHRREREAKLAAALGEPPRAEAELLAAVYDDVDPALLPLAARSLAAGLEKLAEEGRAARAGDGWRRA